MVLDDEHARHGVGHFAASPSNFGRQEPDARSFTCDVSDRRRRILLSVRPRVLGEALADVLRYIGADEVVVLDGGDASALGPFDAAIVTTVPRGLASRVIIRVPWVDGPPARGAASSGDDDASMKLVTLHELLADLDARCATNVARSEHLTIPPVGGR
jgi:hypothetical protein